MNEQPYFGCALTAISAASGLGIETAAVTAAALLGGVAGRSAGITDAAGNLVCPAANLIIAGSDSPRFRRGQELLLSPIAECQQTLRDLSAVVNRGRAEALNSSRVVAGATNAIIAAKPEDDFSHADAQYNRRYKTLRLPGVMLCNPDPSHFQSALDEILDGQPLLVYPDGFFSGRSKTKHLAAVADAVAGIDQARSKLEQRYGYGATQTVHASLFVACTDAELQQAVGSENPDIARLLRQCLILDVPNDHAVPKVTLKGVRDGYFFYQETVREVFTARRAGGGVQFEPEERFAAPMDSYIVALRDWLDQLPAHLLPYFSSALSLPYKILWTLRVLVARGETREWCVPAAIFATNWVLSRQRRLLSQLISDSAEERHEHARRVMLQKLSDGPRLFRTLLRRYSVQRREVHAPILNELVAEGCISLRSDGLLELSEKGKKLAA